MILDATAGNRTMWRYKDSEYIIYIDMEKKLEVKPTIFAVNINTPFLDKLFDTIFYDPPYGWGEGIPLYKYPDAASVPYWVSKYMNAPRYYGWDKFNNQQELIVHLYRAQKEFHRILKDDGVLWLKWNIVKIPIHRVLAIFDLWFIMLELPVKAPTQTAGKGQTYWICLMKQKRDYVQSTLF